MYKGNFDKNNKSRITLRNYREKLPRVQSEASPRALRNCKKLPEETARNYPACMYETILGKNVMKYCFVLVWERTYSTKICISKLLQNQISYNSCPLDSTNAAFKIPRYRSYVRNFSAKLPIKDVEKQVFLSSQK